MVHRMKWFIPLTLSLAFGLGGIGCSTVPTASPSLNTATEEEPLNLSHAKTAVLAYIDDGRYEKGVAVVATEARAWIETRAAARQAGEKLAVVLDIDETVLSNLPHMRAQDFGYNPGRWEEWVATANGPALPAMREVFAAARAADVAVLFLTGRKEPVDRAGTEENLRREGMGDYAELKLALNDNPRRTALERKTEARAEWTAQGWTIIATIGDQESDLGEHAERGFKLPNPFYHIP